MAKNKIGISYDGKWPNLCSGQLIVRIDKEKYVFPRHCLSSGGSASFDENWSEHVASGPWSVREWPENFPEEYKEEVLQKINDKIDWGCCGGCL